MRQRNPIGLLLAACLLLITGGSGSLAQYDGGAVYIERQRPSQQRPAAQPRYVPAPQYGARYQPPPPPPSGFYFPWFQRPPEPVYQPQPTYRPERRREPRPEAEEVRRRAPRATPARDPQVEPSTHFVVFGDSLADLIANGLDEAFAENLDIEIVRKTRSDSGLVRLDHYDWPKAIQEFFAGAPKISYAVVLLGANDRQAIREGEVSHDPLSDRWREIYRERVDTVLRPFVERKVPVVWVGLPPMRSERLSTDFMTLNEIYRDRVQKAGGVYVDIWEAFVNSENRYSPVGPDVDGQVTRLRSNDGVHFTRAGARKAAHFAAVELKRMIEARAPAANVAVAPSAPADPTGANVDRLINAAIPALPEVQGLAPIAPPRPAAGPVLPLNRVDVSPGGALASGRPRLDGDTAHVVERALRDGLPPPPKPGRADDFSWPRP